MPTKSIRCFVAIELPDRIQQKLSEIQDSLRGTIENVSWTRSGNFHLTLKFIGEVEGEKIDRIDAILQQTLLSYKPFSIEIGGIGTFPNMSRPRVLWIGLSAGNENVRTLASSINRNLVKVGISKETRFHPHLTLARFKQKVNLESKTVFFKNYMNVDCTVLSVKNIALIKSDLQHSGAVYTPLKHYKLGQGEEK